MDKASKDASPAPQQGIDWYSFHQGTPAKVGDKQPVPQVPGPDPYDYHQGPSKDGQKPPQSDQPQRKHRLTLYEVAEDTLKAEGKKSYKQDDIYFRLNDMMVAHGYKKANIDGRKNINDHMLPNSWNYVDPRKLREAPKQPEPKPPEQPPKQPDDKAGDPGKDPGKDQPPTSPEEKARAEYQKKVEDYIKDTYSLPPIEKGKGYYDSVAKAHPDWKPKQIMEEAKRIRHLNNDRVNLKVGERIPTISKAERDEMIAKAMREYDEAQKAPPPPEKK